MRCAVRCVPIDQVSQGRDNDDDDRHHHDQHKPGYGMVWYGMSGSRLPGYPVIAGAECGMRGRDWIRVLTSIPRSAVRRLVKVRPCGAGSVP